MNKLAFKYKLLEIAHAADRSNKQLSNFIYFQGRNITRGYNPNFLLRIVRRDSIVATNHNNRCKFQLVDSKVTFNYNIHKNHTFGGIYECCRN